MTRDELSTLDQEFAAENSELCIRIAKQEKELAKLRDLLARLLCWPVWHDLREGTEWIALISAMRTDTSGGNDGKA